MAERPTVCILQARLHHFRVEFYELLKKNLDIAGISLKLIYGQPGKNELRKKDEGHIDWAIQIRNRSTSLAGVDLLWQPCFRHVREAQLVITQQENRMLANYLLLAARRPLGLKVAFWGHGINCQGDPNSLREKWKRLFLTAPDWWFAYTEFTRDILLQGGFPDNRVTVVQNATDTTSLSAYENAIEPGEISALKASLAISGEHTAVYCGSLYDLKRVDFLVRSANLIRQQLPEFNLIIIGAGPGEQALSDAVKDLPWIHMVGPMFGRDKVLHFKSANVFLNPGLVGLAIVESFAMGLPFFTTDCGIHSPEIAYLQEGRNGYMTPVDEALFASQVVKVLSDQPLLARLALNCREDAAKYTIENMAGNFAAGVVRCLQC